MKLITSILLICCICSVYASERLQETSNNSINELNTEIKMIEDQYGEIWNANEIQNSLADIQAKLSDTDCSTIVSDFYNVVLLFITNHNIKECSRLDADKQTAEQYLKYIIKKNIISTKKSLENQLKYLENNVAKQNHGMIFNIILEDYIDKYIANNPIDLNEMFNSAYPSGEMMQISQRYHTVIYKAFLTDLMQNNNHDLLCIKQYEQNCKQYHSVIYNYIIDKLEIAFQNYFITFVENNNFDELMKNHHCHSRYHYVKNITPMNIFEKNIALNNISIYRISYSQLKNSYKDMKMQNMWEEYINSRLYGVFSIYTVGKACSIHDLTNQFIDSDMREYVKTKYDESKRYKR